jgi:dephospho-CoA kinase
VAALLVDHGYTVVEADRIGHEVLEPGERAFDQVADRWPEVVRDDVIDRRALGRIVFSDPDELAALEAITHPEIHRRLADRIGAADGPVVVEIPIPVDWLPVDWPVVVVDVPDETRVARLAGRGMASDEIRARMAAQPSRDAWLALADHVLDNAGTEAELATGVARLLAELSTD